MRKRLLCALLVTFVLGSGLVRAQSASAPDLKPATTTSRSAQVTGSVLERIQNIEEKMVAIAEDFPDDLYTTYRPKGNQDVRTAAEILLHVAGVNRRMGFVLTTKQEKVLCRATITRTMTTGFKPLNIAAIQGRLPNLDKRH